MQVPPIDQGAPTDEDDGIDPLALVSRLVEFVGLGLSVVYLWSVVRQDPEWAIQRERLLAWWRRQRAREAFRRGDTIVQEAEFIVATEAP